jgi:O-6-methylguanine DNA methyltransferase
MALTSSLLPIGRTGVRFEVAGTLLRSVILPKEIPARFDADALRLIFESAAQFQPDWSGATEFTRAVWNRLLRIPAGETMTYSGLAEAIGRPGAARAVGSAVGANRILIVVPCHRVVAQAGLGGFREGLPWKRRLLEIERAGRLLSAA